MGNGIPKAKVKFDRHEYNLLSNMFDGLASRCEGKVVDKTTFLRYFDYPGMFGERLFHLFDSNGDGHIEFSEFITGLSMYLNGTKEEKITLLFKLYDLENDNVVSITDLKTMLYSVMGMPQLVPGVISVTLPPDREKELTQEQKEKLLKDLADTVVDEAFEQCDVSGSGKLSIEQFRKWVELSPSVLEMLDISFAKHLWNKPGLQSLNRTPSQTTTKPHGELNMCPHCRFRFRYCGRCGASLTKSTTLNCEDCGDVFSFGATPKFCLNCGKKWRGDMVLTRSPTRRLPAMRPDKEGTLSFLKTRLGGLTKTFQSRFYALRENFLYAFRKSDTDRLQPVEILFLEGLFIEVPESDPYHGRGYYGIEIITEHHSTTKTLYASSKEEQRDWITALRKSAKTTPIEDFYHFGAEIGTGRFATVYLGKAVKAADDKMYAIKAIDKSKIDDDEREGLRTEIAILKLVDHHGVVKFKEVFENAHHFYIVMDYIRGGDLFNFIVKHKVLSEPAAREILWQIIETVEYLHARGIVHRDLKPENVLLSDDQANRVYLTDFGLSRFATPEEKMLITCGTLCYIAPEVLLMRGYTKAVDLWGVGVIMYLLLSGRMPFGDGKNNDQTIDAILKHPLDLSPKAFQAVSEEAKGLLIGLLRKDSSQRLTAEAARDHPWFKELRARREKEEEKTAEAVHTLVGTSDVGVALENHERKRKKKRLSKAGRSRTSSFSRNASFSKSKGGKKAGPITGEKNPTAPSDNKSSDNKENKDNKYPLPRTDSKDNKNPTPQKGTEKRPSAIVVQKVASTNSLSEKEKKEKEKGLKKEKEKQEKQEKEKEKEMEKQRRLSKNSKPTSPTGLMSSSSSSSNQNKSTHKKSLLERLKETAHIADTFGGHGHAPPPLSLNREEDSQEGSDPNDVMVIDGSKISKDDDDVDDINDDDEKRERTAKIRSESIGTEELFRDKLRLNKEDINNKLPGELISQDKDDIPTRQDSVSSYTEM